MIALMKSPIALASILMMAGLFALPRSSAQTTSSKAISILSFGADPTCSQDTTAIINKAIAAAAASGKELDFPAGCFAHDNLIRDTGVILRGVGDQTELRAISTPVTYPISSWSVDEQGQFTVHVNGNTQIYGEGDPGIPMIVKGVRGYRGFCDPNGEQTAISASLTTIIFKPKSGTCRAGSGTGGTVGNKEPNSAIYMTGNGPQLHNMKITTTFTGPRTSDKYSAPVLNVSTNFVVDGLHIIGSPTSGYHCSKCTHGVESNNVIENTTADGYYHDNCAAYITNVNNKAINTGDDSFSVDSYRYTPCVCHDIQFKDDVSIGSHKRGFEVAGGENISYIGGTVKNAELACIFFMGGETGLNHINYAKNLSATGVHAQGCGGPGVYIASTGAGYPVSDVTISNVTITGIANDAIKLGDANHAETKGIVVSNSRFVAAEPGHSGVLLAGAHSISLQGDSFVGFGDTCIKVIWRQGDPGPVTGSSNYCDNGRMDITRSLQRSLYP